MPNACRRVAGALEDLCCETALLPTMAGQTEGDTSEASGTENKIKGGARAQTAACDARDLSTWEAQGSDRLGVSRNSAGTEHR